MNPSEAPRPTTEKFPLSRKGLEVGVFALLLPLAFFGVWLCFRLGRTQEEGDRNPADYTLVGIFFFLVVVTGYLMYQVRSYRLLTAALALVLLGWCCLGLPIANMRPAAQRMLNHHNLRQLGIAMHNYHNEKNHLPARAIFSKDGKPLLSWRVVILPHVDEESLYNEFHLDEPWDSEHNLKLLPRMPKVFKRPMQHRGGNTMTHYQVIVGRGMIFWDQRTWPVTLGHLSVADGASSTILVTDALVPVPWTKPEDLTYDPEGPIPPLNFGSSRKVAVCFGDCSTREVHKPAGEYQVRLLRQLITWNGGENLDVSAILD